MNANLQRGKSITTETDQTYVPLDLLSSRNLIVIDSDIYKLFISGIVLYPIAFVSTISEEGVENLAPFR
ncbi:hypothetical protein DFJ58DRAFT_660131 [Suillus subalutaceus]|uniref:uncharacterized protein n=1 Tax=Suillus subalutaceus TaxID=48586 RepID=UPI001B8811DF|nr:uncharacterized protein DFJ58DRAFT_660131 [Suillus subalutaceus]KAG1854950.1 hypothetical protein DFJ58DRAFT_660131 [Suillus subalutaceus]